MTIKALNTSIQSAYKNYQSNSGNFISAMDEFYKNGIKTPTLAKILLNDYTDKQINLTQNTLHNILIASRLSTFPYEFENIKKLMNLSVLLYSRSIDAKNIQSDELLKHLESKTKFNQTWNLLYPKTGKTRDIMINANRINSDKVTQKADWLKKIFSLIPIDEYFNNYPKTIEARYKLLYDEQIIKNKVTSRVNNWFKRLSYSLLIKNGFRFKK